MRYFVIGILLSIISGNAQWTRVPGPPVDTGARDPVLSIVSHGPDLWVLTHAGLFQSRDSGLTWAAKRPTAFPRDAAFSSRYIGRLFSADECLFATSPTGLFRSCGSAGEWQRIQEPDEMTWIGRLQGSTGLLVADGYESDIPWLSTDRGLTWRRARNFVPGGVPVLALFQDGPRLWASSNDLGYLDNGGKTWNPVGSDGTTYIGRHLGRLWAGDRFGSLKSSADSGNTWEDAAMPQTAPEQYLQPNSMAEVDGLLFLSGYIDNFSLGGIYMSSDTGETWIPRDAGLRKDSVPEVPVADAHGVIALGKILLAQTNFGVYRSANLGISWLPANQGLPASATEPQGLYSLVEHEGVLYAGASGTASISWFISKDTAKTWVAWHPAIPDFQQLSFTSKAAFALPVKSDTGPAIPLYASTDGMLTWHPVRGAWESIPYSQLLNLYTAQDYAILSIESAGPARSWFSTDGGLTWSADSVALMMEKIHLQAISGGTQFRTDGWSVDASQDSGKSWQSSLSGSNDIEALASNGNLAAIVSDTLFASTDRGAKWSPAKYGSLLRPHAYSLANLGSRLFAGTSRGLLTSTNGLDWKPVGERGLSSWGLRAFAAFGDNMVAGTNDQAYYSMDGGAHWNAVSGLPMARLDLPPMHSVTAYGGGFFAGAALGLWASSDSGKTWNQNASATVRLDPYLKGLGAGPEGLYVVTTNNRVRISKDTGKTWKDWGPGPSVSGEPVPVIGADGGIHALLGEGGYFTDGGAWAKEDLPGPAPHDFLAGTGDALAVSSGDGLYFRHSRNSEWTPVESDLPEKDWTALAMDGNRLYAGLFTQGIWVNTSLPASIRTSVQAPVEALSIRSGKGRRSVFRFGLARPSRVRLSLHSIDGRTTGLFDASLSPGVHEIPMSARTGGTGFYRLQVFPSQGDAPKVVLRGKLPPME
ncbi:MAG: hypothetical protein ABI036_06805 [Fibrobacteria bacterium]